MTFTIDTRELGAEYIDLLKRNFPINFKTLESADIVFSCLGIERKTVRDFFESLNDGRLFSQLKRLKFTYRRQLLLIEGRGMRKNMDCRDTYGLYIRITAGWQIPIIHTASPEETAWVLGRIAKQEETFRSNPFKPRPKRENHQLTLVEKMLCAIPGVGANNAFQLLKHFGSLNQVLAADRQALLNAPGIGSKKAARILEALNQIKL